MRVGLAVKKTDFPVPSDFGVMELQFEKSVDIKVGEVKALRSSFPGVINVHAPYYGTIATDKEQKVRDAMMRTRETLDVARALRSELVVV
ncbi:MAG: hypothetical protein JW834_02380, partial [Candidatus Diapherotrites archaeon]|nr:hypothetical protein [Candidatus Diapherotrites archaeon]